MSVNYSSNYFNNINNNINSVKDGKFVRFSIL